MMTHKIRYGTRFLAFALFMFASGCAPSPTQFAEAPFVVRPNNVVPVQTNPRVEPFRLARLTPSSKKQVSNQLELTLIREINQTRAKHGLASLSLDQNLMNTAHSYASTLSNLGDIDHIGPSGDTPGDRARAGGYNWGFIAENLASGQDTPAITVRDWMKSPGHREALLHKEPVHIGVGHVNNPNDPNYKEYWVMLVGRPLS
ncbi:MAG: CAP domain-containing protein [Alphaproteobacteria bacterium]